MPVSNLFIIMQMLVLVAAAAALFLLGYILWKFNMFRNRTRRISEMRNYKKGSFIFVYILTTVIYFLGVAILSLSSYETNITPAQLGALILDAIITAVPKAADFAVLKFDPIKVLLAGVKEARDAGLIENILYTNYLFTVKVSCITLVISTVVFAISLVGQHIWRGWKEGCLHILPRQKLYILGNNPQNVNIYNSANKKKYSKILIDDISKEECIDYYTDGVVYKSVNPITVVGKNFVRNAIANKSIFVINTGSDEKNIMICREVVERFLEAESRDKKKLAKQTADGKANAKNKDGELDKLYKNLKVYVFGNPQYLAIYEDIVSSGFGCIHYVNKYQKAAVDFIDRHPFSRYMNENQIDYKTSLVKENVDINVILLGFGRTNRQIFLTSVANNQFLTKGENGPVLKQVNYIIFDKDPVENNKNLNHNYYRLKHEMEKMDQADYLPFPTLPAKEAFPHLNVNDANFYDRIEGIVKKNGNDANFVIIAFGSDLENLDMAQKLVEKRREWGASNLIIFVKVRKACDGMKFLDEPGCFFICNEKECVFDIEMIRRDRIIEMSVERNVIYDAEKGVKRDDSIRGWYKLSPLKRDSNIYCSLSLRAKLNCMGLDYCKKKDENDLGLSEEQYFEIYGKGNMPKYTVKDGIRKFEYGLTLKDSLRTNMAVQEHERWNAFMITNGYIPSTRDQILREAYVDSQGKPLFNEDGDICYTDGKNEDARRHGNLTNYEGLREFRKMIASRNNKTEIDTDVIKYDFQLLDDAHRILNKSGYKIIRKQKITMDTDKKYGIIDKEDSKK